MDPRKNDNLQQPETTTYIANMKVVEIVPM